MKKTTEKLEKIARAELVTAICLLVFGCIMITAAFIVPPTAEIHPSVVGVFGEILSFVGAVMGFDYSYKKRELQQRNGQTNDKDL